MRDEDIGFEHVVVDPNGPADPHIKVLGDINGDGRAEIIVASSAGGPVVWYGWPDPVSHSRVPKGTWSTEAKLVWHNPPNLTPHTIAPTGRWSTDAALADMTGNGFPDLVVSEWYTHGRIEWYENPAPAADPAGPWTRHVVGEGRAHDIQALDIDGDGQVEIVARSQGAEGNRIMIWKRVGRQGWRRRDLPCPAGEGLAVGDLTGNGRPDVVIGGRWCEAPADTMRDDWVEHVFADWPEDAVVRLADMTGDGRLDVVMTRSEGPWRLSWFQSPADPRSPDWAEHVVEDSLDFAHSLVVADIDGDGLPDIATAEMHQSQRKRMMVYLNEGGAESWRRLVLAETGSHNLCVGDVTGDGRMDIVGTNWSGDYQPVEMWTQRPNG